MKILMSDSESSSHFTSDWLVCKAIPDTKFVVFPEIWESHMVEIFTIFFWCVNIQCFTKVGIEVRDLSHRVPRQKLSNFDFHVRSPFTSPGVKI